MRYGLLFILILTGYIITAQEVRFEARTQIDQVPKGGTFEVEFNLKNGEGTGFIPPPFKGFRIVSGPMQSYRTTIVNGRRSSSLGFTYSLMAEKEGTFNIKPASISVSGKTISSNQVKVVVLQSNAPVTKFGDDPMGKIFLVAQTDTNQVFIGQQVVIFYRLYTKVNVENYNILSESKYNGCYAQALDAYREPVLKEKINGEEYSTKVLRKVAVFPQQSGKIEIDPLHVRIGIPKRDPRFRGFFSAFNLRTENISSNSISLQVLSPFEGAPASFSGAVGQFNVGFRMSRTNATTDDALALTMHIRGNGDIKTIRAPEISAPVDFELFDAKILSERMINATDSVRGEKSFEYICLISKPDSYQFMPEFTYFNPALDSFITVRDSFEILISPGKRNSGTRSDNQLEADITDGYQDIEMSTRLYRARYQLSASPWYWGAYILPVLGFLFVFWYGNSPHKVAGDELDYANMARLRLESAKDHLDNKRAGLFYEEVAFSIKKFISQKLQVDTSEFNRETILNLLIEEGLASHPLAQVEQLLSRCDYALYSGKVSSDDMHSTYDQAVEVLSILVQRI
ncbi:MAG: BatD family protein [Saprospiraceae bacterium]|nr:BatD family protein [Saprospiraceae bacterium]